MTLFVILSLLLAAATLAILAWRGPAVAHVTDPATAAQAVARPTRGLVVGLGAMIAVVAIGGYAWIGSPRLLPLTPDAPMGPGPAMDAQAEVLQARAEAHPDDAAAWMQAARIQAMLNHGPAAVADYRKVAALRPNDANVLADLADMLAATAPGNAAGSLDGEPIQLVDRALAIDPNHVKALALKGSWSMRQGDFRAGLVAWNQALKVAPPGDPIAQFLRQQIDGMREMAQRAAAGASAPAQ
jgi:cytochrome c-type biogenesis protein CcmH